MYPTRAAASEDLATADTLNVEERYRALYAYFLQNRHTQPIRDFDAAQLHVTPGDVLRKLQSGEPGWEDLVPPQAADLIKERGLFGFRGGRRRPRDARLKTPGRALNRS